MAVTCRNRKHLPAPLPPDLRLPHLDREGGFSHPDRESDFSIPWPTLQSVPPTRVLLLTNVPPGWTV